MTCSWIIHYVLITWEWGFMSFATLGSILDSQLRWESGKIQLARWSYNVALCSSKTTHPSTAGHFFATLGSILDFQLSWKSGQFQIARWSLREAELRREPHPPTTHPTTTHPPPNLRYRNFSPIWCRVPTLGLISNQIPSIGNCCVPPSASPKS